MTTTSTVLNEDQIQDKLQDKLQHFADGFCFQRRSPILHAPSDQGLDYEEVTFPSRDGVPLEGWFIPASGSDKPSTTWSHACSTSASGTTPGRR